MAWNLRGDAPAAPAGQTGRGGAPGVIFFGGRGGRGGNAAPLVAPGRYRATLGRLDGDKVIAMGPTQTFTVVQIPQ